MIPFFVFQLTTLASVALAEPGYFYGYGPGIAAHPGPATSYTYRSPQGIGKRSAEPEPGYYGQYTWPSVSGYGYTATCFGCRGKRSAEPSSYEYANPGVGSFTKVSAPYLFPHFVGPLTKRSAEADAEPHYGYGYGLPGHSYAHFGAGYGYGHYLGKRSADAEPEAEAEADAEPGYG